MTVTARFLCHHVDRWSNRAEVYLNPVYSSDKSTPNHSWSEATPNGKLEMTITNMAAVDKFVPGIEYDITFTPRVKTPA